MIVIDEISMVSSVLFFRLNHRLIETSGCDSEKAFARLPVIVCVDFYQLPPVNGAPIYSVNATAKGLVTFELWQLLEMAEPTEVMCQRADLNIIGILNKIRTGDVDDVVEKVLRSRFISNNKLFQQ